MSPPTPPPKPADPSRPDPFADAILATLHEPLVVLDAGLRVLTANRAFYDAFRATPDNAVGQLLYELHGGLFNAPALRTLLEGLLPQNTSFNDFELSLDVPGSGHRDLLLNARRLHRDRQRTEAILLAMEDVTERRRGEAEARRAAQFLEAISSAGPAVLYALRVEGDILVPEWVSRNVTGIMGYTLGEALAGDWWVTHVHPEDREACVSRIPELLARRRLEMEYRFLRKDGSTAWIRDEARVLGDPAETPGKIVGAWTDVTERRRLQEQFLQAQKMESIGRLAGGVAHDFNNLLGVITGTAELALTGLREGDPLHADLTTIRQAGERGAALTRQLLAFSRRQIFQPQVVNLNNLLMDMEPMLRRVLGEDVQLVMPLLAKGNVRVDPGQIHQVIMNLVVNARDAMANGGVLTLETADVDFDDGYVRRHVGAHAGPFVMLAVTDTGVGMDAATRQHAFEPFFTTKKAGQGTGLGLSTVYGIVKQSGGNVWVYSEPGAGTTFKVYLPRVAEAVTSAPPPRPAGFARGTETILLVEDDGSLCEVARRVLEAAGYTVLAVGSPEEALLRAEHFHGPIHLLLTDVVMPTMRGPELAERIVRLHPEAKVLYMSGYAENAIVHQGELHEGVAFVSKPFDATTLTRRVREVLDTPRTA